MESCRRDVGGTYYWEDTALGLPAAISFAYTLKVFSIFWRLAGYGTVS